MPLCSGSSQIKSKMFLLSSRHFLMLPLCTKAVNSKIMPRRNVFPHCILCSSNGSARSESLITFDQGSPESVKYHQDTHLCNHFVSSSPFICSSKIQLNWNPTSLCQRLVLGNNSKLNFWVCRHILWKHFTVLFVILKLPFWKESDDSDTLGWYPLCDLTETKTFLLRGKD